MSPTRFADDLDHTLVRAAAGLALARDIRRSLNDRVANTAVPAFLWRL